MKQITLLAAALLFMNGCSSKLPEPVQLEDNQGTTINQGIITNHYSGVPQDVYLKNQDWRATLSVNKGRYYLPNEKIIKTFYYAHHAHKITLTGNSSLIRKYQSYFQRNGVTARFCLKSINRKNRRHVNMMFSHLKDDLKNVGCSSNANKNKNISKALTPVIEI